MNDSNKWIKLHSKMLNWEWYTNANVMRLFIHCLLKANWKEGKFEGVEIKRGSFVTSYQKLADELELSKQQIRTALKHLNSTQEITQSQHRKFTVITVVNYEIYQQVNTIPNTKITLNQHSNNTEITPIEEYKNTRILDDIDNYTSTTTGNTHAKENLFELVEKIFGRPLGGTEYEIINAWEDNELTRYAIKQTELARAFNVKYIQRILQSYKNENIKTVAEAEERERKFQESKTTKNKSRGKGESYIQKRLRELKEEENDQK